MAFTLQLDQGLEFRVLALAQDAQIVTNRLDYAVTNAGSPATKTSTDALFAFIVGWRTNVVPFINSTYQVFRYELRLLTGAVATVVGPKTYYTRVYSSLWDFTNVANPLDIGGDVGDALPTWVAATLRKNTGLLGRSFRGSMRISPISESRSLGGGNFLSPGAVAALNTLTAALVLPLNVGAPVVATIEPSLFAAREYAVSPPALQSVPLHNHDLVSIDPNTYLGSQLSRHPNS